MTTVAMTVLSFDAAGVRRVVEHMTAATDWSRGFGDTSKPRPDRLCQRRGHQVAACAISVRKDDLLTGECTRWKRQE
jgi:hypothetical protein